MKTIVLSALIACLPVCGMAQGRLGPSLSFAKLDADGNGRIDVEEAREELSLYSQFRTFDTDGDGGISRREFQRFVGPRVIRPAPED